MARKRPNTEVNSDLNLAPIMNMVMILIPLLLVMVQFEERAISPIEATSAGGAASGETEETVRPPRIIVTVSSDGFRLADFFGSPDFASFAAPIGRCGGAGGAAEGGAAPPTVCLLPDATVTPGNYDGLDYAGLYNRLLQIRMHPAWREAYAKPENGVLLLTAESDAPAAVLIRTMDLTRYFLNPNGTGKLANPLDPSAPVADLTPYLLGGTADNATVEDLLNAAFLITDDAPGLNRTPEGAPANILEMFPNVSFVAPR